MLINYEILLLGTYLTTLTFIFGRAILYLSKTNQYNYNLGEIFNIDKDNNTYNKYILFCQKYKINKEDKILVNIDGNASSMALLNMVLSYAEYNLNNIGFLYFNDNSVESKNKSKLLNEFCDLHSLNYFDCCLLDTNDILQKDMNNFNNKFFHKTYERLSSEFNTSIIFDFKNKDDKCYQILDYIFNGDNLLNLNEECKVYENYKIYQPLYNLSEDKILDLTDSLDIPFFEIRNKSLNKETIMSEFINDIRFTYPEWKDNLIKILRTNIGYEKVLENKYNDLTGNICVINEYVNGITIETNNDYIPYDYWKRTLKKKLSYLECDCDDNIIAKVFFLFDSIDIEASGEFYGNYHFYYFNKKIIIYNLNNIQNYFNEAEVYSFDNTGNSDLTLKKEYTPTIEKVLNGKYIRYNVCQKYDLNSFYDTDIPHLILNNLKIKNSNMELVDKDDLDNNSLEDIDWIFHIKDSKIE